MSPLVWKEVRLLGPSWLVGLFGVTPLWWLLPFQPNVQLAGMLLFLGAAAPFLVSLNSLGREIGLGTFSGLFSVPMARARLWRAKTLVLAVALVALFGLWLMSYFRFIAFEAQHVRPAERTHSPLLVVGFGLFALAAYSGGLWTVMLLRQVAAAFWFAILVPVGLLMGIETIFERFPGADRAHLVVLTLVFTVYSTAGFLWARWMFLRAQDAHWTGGTLVLPRWKSRAKLAPRAGGEHATRPRRALWRKELQLQHGLVVLAGVLALMHLGVLWLRHALPATRQNSVLALVFTGFWGLWLILPLLIGCATVADERKLGTLEASACLPVSRGRQFRIKLLFVLFAGVLFGALIPCLFERSEDALGAVMYRSGLPPWLAVVLPGLWLLLVATSISIVSFYASTLARNTLQALGLAVAMLVALFILSIIGAQPEVALGVRLWRGPLLGFVSSVTLFVTFVLLAWWNFKRGQAGQTLWRRNTVVLMSALAFIVLTTAAIYHRAWEPFTANEPAHGASRLAQTDVVEFASSHENLTVLLSDGRLAFLRSVFLRPGPINWRSLSTRGEWVEGTSKWISAAVLSSQLAAIRGDGSLWVSEQPSRRGRNWATPPLVRVGNATNWQQICSTHYDQGMLLLLSRDGALWRWGHHEPGQPRRIQNLSASEPVRWGSSSDWTEIIPVRESWSLYIRKSDNTVWALNPMVRTSFRGSELEPELPLHLGQGFHGRRWRELVQCSTTQLGVREDGTLWAFGSLPASLRQARVSEGMAAYNGVQVGKDADWKSVAARGEHVIGLKTDGSLWRWDFGYFVTRSGPIRLGGHRDWVAVGTRSEGLVSLAADGSLWRWDSAPQDYRVMSAAIPVPYLGPSRIPQPIGDIFANVSAVPVMQ